MTTPLTPIITTAKATIAAADVPAFLEGLCGLTPLPVEKSASQITSHMVVKNRNGTLGVTVQFSQ